MSESSGYVFSLIREGDFPLYRGTGRGYAMLAISFWPYMIPFSLTVIAAASPHASLAFMFWGEGLFVYPLMLVYTVYSYHVFRGKVDLTSEHY